MKWHCEDRPTKKRKNYSNLRKDFEHLQKGESVEVSIEYYANYRTVLARYNKNHENRYIATRKVGDKLYLTRYR